MWKKKLTAAAWHVSICLLIFGATAIWLHQVAYPDLHFQINGGIQGVLLMFGVDVLLGPLMTLVLFNPAKKWRERVVDMALIVAVQAAALGYGLYNVYQERPKLLVVYPQGMAALTASQFAKSFSDVDLAAFSPITGVPTAFYNGNKNVNYGLEPVRPQQWPQLAQLDKVLRRDLHEQDRALLQQWEQQYGAVHLNQMVGKYGNTVVGFNQQFQYIGHLSIHANE